MKLGTGDWRLGTGELNSFIEFMQTRELIEPQKQVPLCRVFGECGGCRYQDIPYPEELKLKTDYVKELFQDKGLSVFISGIVPSPNPYHYRHRLDLKLLRTREKGVLIGFSPENRYRVVTIEECPIAMRSVSGFIPELKKEAIAKLPANYRMANLTVKTGDDGRVLWGGIGRRSLQSKEQDFLWTQIGDKKIFYSMDTFFQANLSILPDLIGRIRALETWDNNTTLFDCYGGVGLFGISLADAVKKVVLIEECPSSIRVARFNAQFHELKNFVIHEAKVETELPALLGTEAGRKVVFIDPPRKGLSDEARAMLTQIQAQTMFYLSCNPESLVRDLAEFLKQGWRIDNVTPFDFFPRTKHVETLVILRKG